MTQNSDPPRPLSVLALLPGNALQGGLLSVLSKHYTLICESAPQAADSVREFAPDVAVIHSDVPDWELLVDRLVQQAPAAPTVLVGLVQKLNSSGNSAFNYELSATSTADELEEVLRTIVVGQRLGAPARSIA